MGRLMNGMLRTAVSALLLLGCVNAWGQAHPNPVVNNSSGAGTSGTKNRSADPGTDWAATQAEYDAQSAAHKAEAEMYKAQAEALKLKYGPGATGDLTPGGASVTDKKAGQPEALVLVQRSSQAVAENVYNRLKEHFECKKVENQKELDCSKQQVRSVLIIPGKSGLAFGDAIIFDATVAEVTQALVAAKIQYAYAKSQDTHESGGDSGKSANRSGLAIASAVSESLSNIVSRFQSSYEFGPVEITGFDDSAMIAAVAATIIDSGNPVDVFTPSALLVTGAKSVDTILQPITTDYLKVVSEQAVARARAAALTEAEKPIQASHYVAADGSASKAIERYAALIKLLTDVAADGKEPFIVKVAQQQALRASIQQNNPHVLMINASVAAQYYTKKSLWTFFGGPPLHTAGAVRVQYVLFKNDDGKILAAGTTARHGGYKSIRAVSELSPSDK